jgi:hypothetical protein
MTLKETTDAITAMALPEHKEQFGRTFFGSLLGQSIVLLGMIIAYAAAIIFIYQAYSEKLGELNELAGNWLFWSFLLAPLAFILCFSFIPTSLRGWRERRLKRLVMTKGERQPGQFRLHPYGAQDEGIYVRPDDADKRALAWLQETDRSLLYLFGASGAGKSSLLAASVLPKLEAAGWECLSLRVDHDPEAQLRETLLTTPKLFSKAPSPNAGLITLFQEAAKERQRKRAGPLLLVIDQFEEFLILNDEAARAPVIALLHDLDKAPLAGLRLLCVFRSDYRELLFKLGLPRYIPGENSFELAPFLRSEAEALLSRSGHVLSPEGYKSLFAGLDRIEEARGLYRPITLNMVGLVLERMNGRIDGDPERLIERYLRNCLAQGQSRDFSRGVLGKMITASGTKEPRDLTALASLTRFEPWQVESTLTDLEIFGLVRALDGMRTRWEVSHDFLARQIGILLGRMRLDWLRRNAPLALTIATAVWGAGMYVGLVILPMTRAQDASRELKGLGFKLELESNRGNYIVTADRRLNNFALGRLSRLSAIVSNMTVLNLPNAERLTSLEPLQGMNLESLSVGNALQITSLDPLRKLPLKSLTLHGAAKITSLAPLEKIPLILLSISGAKEISSLEPLRDKGLKYLRVLDADRIVSIEPLRNMKLLELTLLGCAGITGLEPLKDMPLEFLNLSGADKITSLSPLERMPLRRLVISGAYRISSLAPLEGMKLTNLSFSNADGIVSLEPLRNVKLVSLSLLGAKAITSLDPLKDMPLEDLTLSGAAKITSLAPLEKMPLQRLSISSAYGISSLAPLRDLPLTDLAVSGAKLVGSLEPLHDLPLKSLRLSGISALTSLEPLRGMKLTALSLSGAGNISSLEPLKGMQLTVLKLSNLDSLDSIEPLRNMPLKDLDLSRSGGITSLAPLEGAPLLWLNISNADGIKDLEPLKNIRLSKLDITEADGIASLAPLKGLDPAAIVGASDELLETLQ